AIARGINATPTLTAAANNDVLVGLDIAPTFTNGAFTGVSNLGLRVFGTTSLNAASTGFEILATSNNFFIETAANGTYRVANLINYSGYSPGARTNVTADVFSVGFNGSSSSNGNRFFRINSHGGNSTGAYGASGNNNILAQLNSTTSSYFYISAQGSVGLIEQTANANFKIASTNAANGLELRADRNGVGSSGGGIYYYASQNGTNDGHRWYHNLNEQMRLFFNGNLFIGSTPVDGGFRLDVNGTARVQSFTTINAAPAVNSDAALSVNATTNNSTGGQMYGIRSVSTVATNTGNLTGIDATINNSTTAQNMAGFNSAVNVTANTTAQVRGYSVGSAVTGTGIVTNFIGYDFIDVFKSGSGAITRQIAYRIANLTAGSAANIGILFNNAGASTVNGTWDIYSQSGNASYLAGNLLLGTTSDIGGRLQVAGTITATSAIARGINVNNTLVAAANNDVLVGLDINPTFTNGAFTGVTNLALRTTGNASINGNLSGVAAYITTGAGAASHLLELVSTSSTNGYANFRRGGGANGTTAYQLSNGAASFSYNAGTGETQIYTSAGGGFLTLYSGNTEAMRIFSTTRNILLQNGGTFTDAGFRLDVNGTARVQGATTISTGGADITGGLVLSGGGNFTMRGGAFGSTRTITFQSEAGNNTIGSITATQLGTNRSNIYLYASNLTTGSLFKLTGGSSAAVTAKLTGGQSNNGSLDFFQIQEWNATPETGAILASIGNLGQGRFGQGTNEASAVLQANSTTAGFLPPRMTGAQAEAIATPATGLLVYANNGNGTTITTTGWWGYDGATWVKLN
ncbi:MAG: beta strand repeat-containing protein, partial [Dolichospermum sp.]